MGKPAGKSSTQKTDKTGRSERAHARSRITKDARIAAAKVAAQANVDRREAGEPTPWEATCAARTARRAHVKVGNQS